MNLGSWRERARCRRGRCSTAEGRTRPRWLDVSIGCAAAILLATSAGLAPEAPPSSEPTWAPSRQPGLCASVTHIVITARVC
jgi:hypothetical protein